MEPQPLAASVEEQLIYNSRGLSNGKVWWPLLCGSSFVPMMKAADLSDFDDLTQLLWLNCSRGGRVFCQRQVSARIVIILEVAPEDPPQVAFSENDHVIQTLSPDTSDDPFRGAGHRS